MSFHPDMSYLQYLDTALSIALLGGMAHMLIRWGAVIQKLDSINDAMCDLRARVGQLEREAMRK